MSMPIASILNPDPAGSNGLRGPAGSPVDRPSPLPSMMTTLANTPERHLLPSRGPGSETRSRRSPQRDCLPMAHTSAPYCSRDDGQSSAGAAERRQGAAKAPVFFPPHVDGLDQKTLDLVGQFVTSDLSEIAKSHKRVPYRTDKRDFETKTGRSGFEVFEYNFRVPGKDKDYTVMWDYQVGLVRVTSFFKCLDFAKTAPAKVLDKSQGLKDMSFSITGGSISAQGYWFPFGCALAVCTRFCQSIAPAFIPIFGPDFVMQCELPSSPKWRILEVEPDVVHRWVYMMPRLYTLLASCDVAFEHGTADVGLLHQRVAEMGTSIALALCNQDNGEEGSDGAGKHGKCTENPGDRQLGQASGRSRTSHPQFVYVRGAGNKGKFGPLSTTSQPPTGRLAAQQCEAHLSCPAWPDLGRPLSVYNHPPSAYTSSHGPPRLDFPDHYRPIYPLNTSAVPRQAPFASVAAHSPVSPCLLDYGHPRHYHHESHLLHDCDVVAASAGGQSVSPWTVRARGPASKEPTAVTGIKRSATDNNDHHVRSAGDVGAAFDRESSHNGNSPASSHPPSDMASDDDALYQHDSRRRSQHRRHSFRLSQPVGAPVRSPDHLHPFPTALIQSWTPSSTLQTDVGATAGNKKNPDSRSRLSPPCCSPPRDMPPPSPPGLFLRGSKPTAMCTTTTSSTGGTSNIATANDLRINRHRHTLSQPLNPHHCRCGSRGSLCTSSGIATIFSSPSLSAPFHSPPLSTAGIQSVPMSPAASSFARPRSCARSIDEKSAAMMLMQLSVGGGPNNAGGLTDSNPAKRTPSPSAEVGFGNTDIAQDGGSTGSSTALEKAPQPPRSSPLQKPEENVAEETFPRSRRSTRHKRQRTNPD